MYAFMFVFFAFFPSGKNIAVHSTWIKTDVWFPQMVSLGLYEFSHPPAPRLVHFDGPKLQTYNCASILCTSLQKKWWPKLSVSIVNVFISTARLWTLAWLLVMNNFGRAILTSFSAPTGADVDLTDVLKLHIICILLPWCNDFCHKIEWSVPL